MVIFQFGSAFFIYILIHLGNFFLGQINLISAKEKQQYGEVRYPDDCDACRFFSIEFMSILERLSSSNGIIETGYFIDGQRRKYIKYDRSELSLIEALEGTCDKMFEYKVHKDRTDSNRFGRGLTDTFKSLQKLVKQGVKVDIGIPYEMWDIPTGEIHELRSKCFNIIERYGDFIEEWYWGARELSIQDYLCRDRILKPDQIACLSDPPPLYVDDGSAETSHIQASKDGQKGEIKLS